MGIKVGPVDPLRRAALEIAHPKVSFFGNKGRAWATLGDIGDDTSRKVPPIA
jgi:hypothetical protein